MMPSITRSTDLVFHQGIRSTMDVGKPEPSHGPDALLAMLFDPQGVDHTISLNLCENLKKYHDTIFDSIPPHTKKPFDWLNQIIGGLPSMLKRVLGTPHAENFQRKVHVEIDVPGVCVHDAILKVFFDIYSPFDFISENCATQFGILAKSNTVQLVKHVRWHAKKDRNLKEPRLHFNDRRYEEGEFRYAKLLGKFDLVIGWNTIQALKLLEPKDDIAAAGEGFRQLAPSVDKDAARRNQSMVADAQAQEWEAMEQHKKAQKENAAAAASRTNGHRSM